jgi:hypothetical protein
VDVCYGGFGGGGVGGYFDFVVEGCPVCSLIPHQYLIERYRDNKWSFMSSMSLLTIITTCFTPFAKAASPHFFQYVAEFDSSPSIMVEPWEKKCTGVEAILTTGSDSRCCRNSVQNKTKEETTIVKQTV